MISLGAIFAPVLIQILQQLVGPLLMDLVRALVVKAEQTITGEGKGPEKLAFVSSALKEQIKTAGLPPEMKILVGPMVTAAVVELNKAKQGED